MAEFNKTLDVYQGYNFKKDKQSSVGFITKLKIGDKQLDADQNCKDPTNPETDVKVVSVLSHVLWETGVTDAVYFAGQVSTANKQSLAELVYKTLTNVAAEYQFELYEYDPIAKKYFLCFHSNKKDMKGLLEKRGDELNLSIADDASREVQSPENYAFHTGVKPTPEAQVLQMAVGDGKSFAKAWGVKLGS